MKYKFNIIILTVLFSLYIVKCNAQQDPQYTQYMYNTMSVNPGYAGSNQNLTITGLHRSQWVGLDGAPTTQTLGVDTFVGSNVGLGLNIVNDKLGPANETYFDGNFSYTIPTGVYGNLAFGIKAGMRLFSVDFSKGISQTVGDTNLSNIKSKILPNIGAGIYYYTEKAYVGLSVPNFLTTEHYDDVQNAIASERLHFFLIGGYVFDVNTSLKFKPAFLAKAVSGTPLSVDVSANFLVNEKLTLGLGYRWDDSINALAGFQISEGLFIGYSYDHTTSSLNNYSNGSHEIILKYNLINTVRIKSPRFF